MAAVLQEHAPIAIKAAGVSCVIAETLRDFYRNAINIGLPIIECPEASRGLRMAIRLKWTLTQALFITVPEGTEFQGQAFPEFMQNIIQAGGLINYIIMQKPKINIYQLPDPGQVSEADFWLYHFLSISFVFCKRRKTEYA